MEPFADLPLRDPVTKEDIQDHFKTHGAGTITEVKLMNGFGFIEYDDAMDARDVVPAFHGSDLKGSRLTVQFARGPRPRDQLNPPDRSHPRPRRTAFRMQLTGLPEGTSWQDLKDFARQSGLDVVYSEVGRERDGRGFVEFETSPDLKTAVEKLDNRLDHLLVVVVAMGPRLMNTTVVVALLAVIVLAAKDMAAAVRRLVMTTTAVEDMTLHPFEVFVDLLLMITLLLEVLIAKTPMLVHLQAAMTILILRATIAHPDRGAHPEVMAVMTRLRVVTDNGSNTRQPSRFRWRTSVNG
ncbi:MAG: hypothetical protein LQ340_005368 [Diploschistes diacapsis]|nr:MAG: hypothetical protein LQ340_005368 [Diploschistes diacapsis]